MQIPHMSLTTSMPTIEATINGPSPYSGVANLKAKCTMSMIATTTGWILVAVATGKRAFYVAVVAGTGSMYKSDNKIRHEMSLKEG